MLSHASIARVAYDLAPLPATATRLAAVIGQPDWDLGQVVQVVQLDPALSGHVLRFANSALSGAQREISSIDEAVMRIGPGMVLGLAMGAGVRTKMNESVPAYGISAGELWRHAVCAGLAADVARRHCGTPIPNEAFPTALLHDIGKQVLGRFLDEPTVAVLEVARTAGRCSEIEAEAEVLGVHHCEVGGLVAQHWKLPKVFVLGITHHHDPAHTPPDEDPRIAYAVCLADLVARRIGYSTSQEPVDWRDWPDLLRVLETRPSRLDRLCEAVAERVEDVIAAYS